MPPPNYRTKVQNWMRRGIHFEPSHQGACRNRDVPEILSPSLYCDDFFAFDGFFKALRSAIFEDDWVVELYVKKGKDRNIRIQHQ